MIQKYMLLTMKQKENATKGALLLVFVSLEEQGRSPLLSVLWSHPCESQGALKGSEWELRLGTLTLTWGIILLITLLN